MQGNIAQAFMRVKEACPGRPFKGDTMNKIVTAILLGAALLTGGCRYKSDTQLIPVQRTNLSMFPMKLSLRLNTGLFLCTRASSSTDYTCLGDDEPLVVRLYCEPFQANDTSGPSHMCIAANATKNTGQYTPNFSYDVGGAFTKNGQIELIGTTKELFGPAEQNELSSFSQLLSEARKDANAHFKDHFAPFNVLDFDPQLYFRKTAPFDAELSNALKKQDAYHRALKEKLDE